VTEVSKRDHLQRTFACAFSSPATSTPCAFSYPLIEGDVGARRDRDEFGYAAQGGQSKRWGEGQRGEGGLFKRCRY
jgi:hypothetical protein